MEKSFVNIRFFLAEAVFRCYIVNVSNVVKKNDRRWCPAVNLAPCICVAAVVYKSTLPCCARCKTRHCLTDASTEANKRVAYVDKI